MRKLVLSLSIVAGLFANTTVLPKKTVDELINSSIKKSFPTLPKAIKDGQIKVTGVEKDGFYILHIITPRGNGNIFITKDKKYTIAGKVFDNSTGKEITYPVNKEIVDKGVSFTFGKGKKEIYVVTDPECPFCRKMEHETKANLEKNYKVHVILFPLSFHKYAKPMSYYILAGKTDAEKAKRFSEVLGGSNEWKKYHPTKEEKAKFDKILSESNKAVSELGARGTPTVYDKDFNQIAWPTLKGTK